MQQDEEKNMRNKRNEQEQREVKKEMNRNRNMNRLADALCTAATALLLASTCSAFAPTNITIAAVCAVYFANVPTSYWVHS